MKVTSVVKMAIVYQYVTTDEKESPNYRRNEDGYWERLIAGRWEVFNLSGELRNAFQHYLNGMPLFDLGAYRVNTDAPLEDGVYHIEHIDADHVRLTKKQ